MKAWIFLVDVEPSARENIYLVCIMEYAVSEPLSEIPVISGISTSVLPVIGLGRVSTF